MVCWTAANIMFSNVWDVYYQGSESGFTWYRGIKQCVITLLVIPHPTLSVLLTTSRRKSQCVLDNFNISLILTHFNKEIRLQD